MKIAIVNNCVPFLRGGAEYLADSLAQKLKEHGHESTVIRLPFTWEPAGKILEHILACRLMRIPNVDRVIALKFPAYFVPHPNKVLWLLHQFRQAYDFWGTSYQGIPDTTEGREIRDTIHRGDNSFLPEARFICANSEVTRDRLKRFNGLDSTVLYPPLLTDSDYGPGDFGDYVFAPGRINSTKRQKLLVESIRFCKSKVRLIVAGHAEDPADAAAIERVIRNHQLQDRVVFANRFISEEEKIEWFRNSAGCAYIPYDEDSYGYVTLESFLCRKPVITCTDSGGIEILVKEEATGFVVPPKPQDLARAMDSLYEDRIRGRTMGQAGFELANSLKINWEHVVQTLTA